MSYLGSPPASQFFAPGTDTFSGDGTTVAFTLSRNVATVNDILVVVNNVDQQPTAYTVSVSTLTFTAAPSSGTNNIYVRYLSTNLTTIVPQTGSVSVSSFSATGTPSSSTFLRGDNTWSSLTLPNSLTAGTGLTATSPFNGSTAVTFNATGSTINSQTSSYVLVAADAGKTISITTGGVTVPNSVLAAGNIVTIYNNSGSSQTITQGAGVTLQWAGQTASSTGNRTLGLYGIATLIYITASTAVISGAGLT
jgi:hypothetical protein